MWASEGGEGRVKCERDLERPSRTAIWWTESELLERVVVWVLHAVVVSPRS